MVQSPVWKDNPLAKAPRIFLRTGGRTMLYPTFIMIYSSTDLSLYGLSHAYDLCILGACYKKHTHTHTTHTHTHNPSNPSYEMSVMDNVLLLFYILIRSKRNNITFSITD